MSLYTSTIKIHAFLARMIFEQPPEKYILIVIARGRPRGNPCFIRHRERSVAIHAFAAIQRAQLPGEGA
jgi:hypothetical protein